MKKTLGESAGLAAMTNLGLQVPPGATLSVSVCKDYLEKGPEVLEGLNELIFEAVDVIGEEVSKSILEEKYRLCRAKIALAVVGALWSRSKHAWDDGYGVKSEIERSSGGRVDANGVYG